MQISFYRVIQERSEASGKEVTSKDITTAFRQTYHLGASIYEGRLVLKSFSTLDVRTPSLSSMATPDLEATANGIPVGRLAQLEITRDRPEDSPDRSANEKNLHSSPKRLRAKVSVDGKVRDVSGEGNGPLSSFLDALIGDLGISLSIREYSEHSVGVGSDVKAATYVELIPPDADPKDKTQGGYWGVGVDADITASGLKAVVSAANGYLDTEKVEIADAL